MLKKARKEEKYRIHYEAIGLLAMAAFIAVLAALAL